MEKVAADPKFDAIKQHKKNWNKATKELISRLIAFKRAINGAKDDKFALPSGKIHEPVPSEIINFLNTLTSNYESVASDALKIISEQNDFAKERESHKKASINIYASSKLSRFWAYLKSPFLSDDNKKYRLSLLRSLASLEDIFKDFEGSVLSSGNESIAKSISLLAKITKEIEFIHRNFNSLLSDQSTKSGKVDSIEPVISTDLITNTNLAIEDMLYASNIPGAETHRQSQLFNELSVKFKSEADENIKQQLANQILGIYHNLLDIANSLHKQSAKSFKDLFEAIRHKKNTPELTTVANNFISRWLDKKKHEINPLDKTSAIRLSIQNISEESRKLIDSLLNALETELDISFITTELNKLAYNINNMKNKMMPLRSQVSGAGLDKPIDMSVIKNIMTDENDPNQLNRLKKKYDTLTDRKILDLLLK